MADTGSKILIVDDEPNILNALKRALRKEEFTAVTMESPLQALQLLEKEKFKIIVSDQRMPEMMGAEFLERSRQMCPDAIRILLTGYSDAKAAMDAVNKGGIFRYITKPWNDEDITLELRRALYQYHIVEENRVLHQTLEDMNLNLEKKVEERTLQVSRLNQELRKSFTGTVNLLADIAEMHNAVLGSHSERVSKLSKEIAKNLGLDEAHCFKIGIAATLHDIGEIRIPAALLEKIPSQMSDDEHKTYLNHALISESIVSQIPFSQEAAKMVRHHHEFFNGTGFPDKLQGEEIPIGSRIIAVADAFDVYLNTKQAFVGATSRSALTTIKGYTPAWYDPKVVVVLEKLLQNADVDIFENIEKEVEIKPRELTEGMVLARDLKTSKGVLILPKDTSITPLILKRIHNYADIGWSMSKIYIKRG